MRFATACVGAVLFVLAGFAMSNGAEQGMLWFGGAMAALTITVGLQHPQATPRDRS